MYLSRKQADCQSSMPFSLTSTTGFESCHLTLVMKKMRKTMFEYKIDEEVSLALPRPKLDATPLFALIDDSRAQIAQWLPWVEKLKSIADEETFLMKMMARFGTGSSLNAVIRFKGQAAGMISFNKFHAMDQSTDIGYWLGNQFVGNGIMHRAVAGMCDLGFTDYHVHKIIIEAAVDNRRSNQVAEKAGFTCDGSVRANMLLADGYHDGNIWTMLADEWQNKQ